MNSVRRLGLSRGNQKIRKPGLKAGSINSRKIAKKGDVFVVEKTGADQNLKNSKIAIYINNKKLDKNDFLKNDGNEIQSCEDFNN
jgi:hypothetical protein